MHKQKSLFQALASGQQNDETKQTNRRYPLLYFCVVWLEGSYYSLGFSVSVCNSFLFLLCTPQKPYKTLKVSPLNHFSQCARYQLETTSFYYPGGGVPLLASLPLLLHLHALHSFPRGCSCNLPLSYYINFLFCARACFGYRLVSI